MKRLCWTVVIVLSLALAGSASAAQGKGQAKGKGKQPAGTATAVPEEKPKAEKAKPAVVPALGRGEQERIRNWFRGHRGGLPPGLAKREQLPPGLQRHLEKNGVLPPGLQKMVQPLPAPLEQELPKLPVGYRRYVIAGHVILVEERTARIVDIVRDVIE